VCFVIPTYNEALNITSLLGRLTQLYGDAGTEFLVVDDESPDGTARLVREFASTAEGRVHLLEGKRRGLGDAYVRGITHAMDVLGAEVVVQMAGESDALLRVRAIDVGEKDDLLTGLSSAMGSVEELGFSAIGPVVGEELTRAAIIAVAVASGLILLYVTWAFRGMQHSFRFGVAAIVALLHDALFVIGVFSILGHALNVQIDALFVTALLTVIGFSVNDSIVVFDRIRETNRDYVHLDEHERPGIADIINFSANQSLTRSLNTSFTALLVLLALLLLGGPTIRDFVLALSLGFAIGTYSSIFNAACLVASWEQRDLPRLWRRLIPWRRMTAS